MWEGNNWFGNYQSLYNYAQQTHIFGVAGYQLNAIAL